MEMDEERTIRRRIWKKGADANQRGRLVLFKKGPHHIIEGMRPDDVGPAFFRPRQVGTVCRARPHRRLDTVLFAYILVVLGETESVKVELDKVRDVVCSKFA